MAWDTKWSGMVLCILMNCPLHNWSVVNCCLLYHYSDHLSIGFFDALLSACFVVDCSLSCVDSFRLVWRWTKELRLLSLMSVMMPMLLLRWAWRHGCRHSCTQIYSFMKYLWWKSSQKCHIHISVSLSSCFGHHFKRTTHSCEKQTPFPVPSCWWRPRMLRSWWVWSTRTRRPKFALSSLWSRLDG